MTTLTVNLPDIDMERLREAAAVAGVAPEDFVTRLVRTAVAEGGLAAEISKSPALSFEEAARYVFRKNAELYRRLAK
jgi:hypothetical protein